MGGWRDRAAALRATGCRAAAKDGNFASPRWWPRAIADWADDLECFRTAMVLRRVHEDAGHSQQLDRPHELVEMLIGFVSQQSWLGRLRAWVS